MNCISHVTNRVSVTNWKRVESASNSFRHCFGHPHPILAPFVELEQTGTRLSFVELALKLRWKFYQKKKMNPFHLPPSYAARQTSPTATHR
ncbi:hypothetical protein PCANC_16778 [Puccinia coronata f. sp. avenae]|uniref:Uncharacterized protein n=1 Tax=Puccinia coronata f. sp. avenae TaxID=200324 RepID=A0A2N5V6E6_9BASI|nr:hypothetical protein PCANC_16778 [Puccinia coronata f. sp. avenae]PLW45567.1 hypothetical protein PCASD_06284 [Puccinia coronata f. sp. avenae]